VTLFGAPSYRWGTYTSAAPAQSLPSFALAAEVGATAAAPDELVFAGSIVRPQPGDAAWANAGLSFWSNHCIDASSFDAVRFTVEGDWSGCKLRFQVNTVEDVRPAWDPKRGVCTAERCMAPGTFVAAPGTYTVPFASLGGGTPRATVDLHGVTSVQWQIEPR
jgi:hypothetical protein